MKHDGPCHLAEPVISRETRQRLEVLTDLIRQWSGAINLVSRGDLERLWDRHIADSLQLMPLLPPAPGTWVDLGSGAGLPGLVIAIASNRPVHLVESDHRKAAFLREAARRCEAEVTVHSVRIEGATLPLAGLITARALAPLPQLLELAAPHLAQAGICLFLKGRTAAAELTLAAAEWHMHVQRWPSRTSADAVILQISELAPRARSKR